MNTKLLKTISKWLAFLFLAGVLALLIIFFYYTYDLPKPDEFSDVPFIQSTKIFDRTGKTLLFDIYGEEKREIVPFDKISENLKRAVVASEDDSFYKHNGIDFKGIIRAVLVDLKFQAKSQGGSTITQQLIRSVYLTKQKSVSRKIKEIVLSIELEQKYSKDQILNWYLNEIPFGENAYGAESASQTYFGKPASDLTLAESAVLTAIIPAPSRYSPYGPYKAQLLAKKDAILEKMEKLGYITKDQLNDAKKEKINFIETTVSIKAPDFVLYIKKYLEEKYGEDYLKEKGLKVYTTLDWDLQEFVEKTMKDADESLRAKRAYNSASVVINPKNGEILALAGSKDYFASPYPEGCDEKNDNSCLFAPKYDVATMGQRQPGSSFKPFVYATAFKKGFSPETVLWDVNTEFNPSCQPDASGVSAFSGVQCYSPQNYDGLNRGPVSLRQALSGSLNIPAVKTLYLAGMPETLQTAKDCGITTLNEPDRYGLSLVLGGGEVNLLELTSAYGVFATEGLYTPPASILKIEDSDGNIIEQSPRHPVKVLDTQVARQINSILSDNNARSFIFGLNSPLYLPDRQVAAKTGTTQNYKDGWTVGYSPSVVVGVWVGNNNNAPTNDSGVGSAAPIWNKIISKALLALPEESFTQPDPAENKKPALAGQLPKTDINTILYYVDKSNPEGPPPQNPSSDPQYALWQIGINNWLLKGGLDILTTGRENN